jgi:signal transduction histidine kinase/PAS domain-containing protein
MHDAAPVAGATPYERIFEFAPHGLADLSPQGLILHANAALRKLFGWEAGVPAATSCLDIADERAQQLLAAALGVLFSGDRNRWTIGGNFRRPDGTFTRLIVTLNGARGQDGRFAGAIAQFEERADGGDDDHYFRELFEQAPYGVALYTPEGWQRRCNYAFFALFGPPEQGTVRHHLPTDPHLVGAGHAPLLARAFAGEMVTIPPVRYDTVTSAGAEWQSPRWIGSVIFPLRDVQGTIREIAVVFNDVTEQYRAEEALRASNERLEARVAERTDELTTLLDITREVAATLELDPLLGLLLDRLSGLVTATMLVITVLDGDELVQVEYRGPGTREGAVGRRFPIDQGGALWRAFQHGRPVTINDVLTDTELAIDLLRSFARSQPSVPTITRSWLGVPLKGKGETIGMLALAHIDPDHFTAQDERLVAAFAAQATVAVENAHLYRDLQGQLAQVAALSAVGAALVEERDLERVLRTVGSRVIDLLQADGCAIALLDPDEAARVPGQELLLAVVLGDEEARLQGLRIPLVGSFLGEAIVRGGPVISADNTRDPRGYPPATPRLHNSMLALPLRTSERSVGALNVFGRSAAPFDQRDIALLTLFAQQAAVAIENARFYEQAQSLAVLEERQRLARELHDSVSQALYGIALGARTARTLLDRDPARVAEPLDYVLNLAEAGLTEMRALIFELRPESLATEGLGAALGKMADAIRVRHRLAVDLDLGDELVASLPTKEALYRITQEATNNAIKHARASLITIALTSDEHGYHLAVRDDGVGFDPHAQFEGHFGLTSMRERAGRLGGTVDLASAPGAGTTITVTLPLTRP